MTQVLLLIAAAIMHAAARLTEATADRIEPPMTISFCVDIFDWDLETPDQSLAETEGDQSDAELAAAAALLLTLPGEDVLDQVHEHLYHGTATG